MGLPHETIENLQLRPTRYGNHTNEHFLNGRQRLLNISDDVIHVFDAY